MLKHLLATLLVAVAAVAAPASSQAFESDRIRVEVRGTGKDVVLIPGLSSSPEVWEGTVAAVPGYRYHLIQVAGFAGAPSGANASGPVVAPVADEIARYIKEAELVEPALVGHSMGGSLAMMVAARHPGAAGKVMVVDMLPFMGAMFGPPGTPPEKIQAIAAQIRDGIRFSTGEAKKAQMQGIIASMVKTEAMRERTLSHSLESDPAVSGQAMYDLITTDLRPELKSIAVPLTVLWVVPQGAPMTLEQTKGFYTMSYAGVPQAVLTHIPDAYHFIMFDAPERFQAELRSFLAGA